MDLLTAREATDNDLLLWEDEEEVAEERMVGLWTLMEGIRPSTALALGGRGGRESNTERWSTLTSSGGEGGRREKDRERWSKGQE